MSTTLPPITSPPRRAVPGKTKKKRPAETARSTLPHFGGLDGLRAIAVAGVILYHGGVAWASGGFLGVEVFFVLSGFLITSLLVEEWMKSGTIGLRAFWGRRARRLLPALFLLVAVIGIYYWLSGPSAAVPGFWGDGVSALLYFSNWHQIAAGASYFVASGPVSPFQHTWSLSIEEQFYVLWPLVILGVTGWVIRRGGSRSPLGALRLMLMLTVIGLIASALEMGLLFGGGRGLDRVYYGTDTRATGLLAGAALALWLAIRHHSAGARSAKKPALRRGPIGELRAAAANSRVRRVLSLASGVLLALLIVFMYVANGSSAWLYPYGFLLVDAASVLLIALVVLRSGSVAEGVLCVVPLQAIGQISYGLYLWHFPLFLWLDQSSTGLSGVHLLMFRIGVTLLVAAVSYVFVEQPIRQRRLPVIQLRRLTPLAAAAAFASLLIASSFSAMPTGVSAAARLPKPPVKLRGSDPACSLRLADTPGMGVAPIPLAQEAQFEYDSLGKHALVWSGTATRTFHTCPPKRIMVIGDSLAFTLGVPMLDDENRYGVEVADAANLGCAFATRGELNVNGTWETPETQCQNPLATWLADENAFHPSAVVLEMGYRDEFEWEWNGVPQHLGDPAFDRYEQAQINAYVNALSRNGTKVLLLAVPFTHPPDQANGAPAPAASPARHSLINAMLAQTASEHPGQVALLNLDQTVSPGNQFNARLNGQVCRFDGIHFSIYCAKLLEPQILAATRGLLSSSAWRAPNVNNAAPR